MTPIVNGVRDVLEERGVTQLGLAELAGLSYPVVRRAIRPGGNPFLDHALRIAGVLGMPVDQLFRLNGPPERRG